MGGRCRKCMGDRLDCSLHGSSGLWPTDEASNRVCLEFLGKQAVRRVLAKIRRRDHCFSVSVCWLVEQGKK